MDHAERSSPAELNSAEQLQATAAGYGMQLDPQRLEQLVAKADRAADMLAENEKVGFSQDGMMIAPPTEVPDTDETISQMHYLPKTRDMPRGATVTQRGESMGVIHRGLRAMQDYALLTTAGLIPQPDRFLGHTNNTEMATIAARFGFEEQQPGSGDVTATFETVRDNVLSPESVRLEAALSKRVSAAAGNTALHQAIS